MNYIKINENDNVCVATVNLNKSDVIEVNGDKITLLDDIPVGHKFAIKDIAKNDSVIKYGMPIGHVLEDIKKGNWLHTHNLKTSLEGKLEYKYIPHFHKNPTTENKHLTFMGFPRKNGDYGIRNELWIVPTVGCIASLGDIMINSLKSQIDTSKIDGILVAKHPYGCSQLGDDLQNTRLILQDLAKHPNAGGVLVFGLGCENNIVEDFKNTLGDYDKDRVRFLIAQKSGDEIAEGVNHLKELYELMKEDKRVEVPISKLRIGLKCGGSDGFSGITANPLLGRFSDFLISQGGTTVLTEVPEMFGAETLLMERTKDVETFNKTVSLINNFKEYFIEHKQNIYENPSPGNKAGGITTLEEKSLGCIQKGGSEVIVDILNYGSKIKKDICGLNLLEAPGNDGVASTALGASGCHIVLFTTGRGTPLGTFVPTIKVATNTPIYELKKHWLDFNAGVLMQGVKMEDLLEDFINYILEVANGKKTNSEKQSFRDVVIFKKGVTL